MNATEFDSKEFVSSLPRRPGVYRMYNGAHELLYVGKAKNLRMAYSVEHFAEGDLDAGGAVP